MSVFSGLRKIEQLGTRDLTDPAEAKRIRIINICAMLAACGYFAGLFTKSFMHEYFNGIIIGVFGLLCLSVLLLNYLQFYATAVYVFIISVNLSQAYFEIWYGIESGMLLYYFPFMLAIGLMYHKPEYMLQQGLFMLISIGFLVISLTCEFPGIVVHEKIDNDTLATLFRYNLFTSILLTCLLVYFVIKTVLQLNSALLSLLEDGKTNEERIQHSLDEKEVLLAEVHHRVKNNLAIINGLLNLQKNKTSNAEAAVILEESRNRIISMAMVHEKLYKTKDFSGIEMGSYLQELGEGIIRGTGNKHLQFKPGVEEIKLPVATAIPVGLMVNEIITNSIKHAYPEKWTTHGVITLTLKKDKDHARLTCTDNGQGFPDGFDADIVDTLGVLIIQSLADQIEGRVLFKNENGAQVEIMIPLTGLA